jgi:lysozyme
MRISDDGLNALKNFESPKGVPKLRAYRDDAGVWTIGYGHIRGVKQDGICTELQATQYLLEDVQGAELAVRTRVKVDLTQSEFDALVIWEFNTGGLATSTALKLLNKGDYEGCIEAMQKWIYVTDPMTRKKVKNNGLMNRRAAEAMMWHKDFVHSENGQATPTPPPEKVIQTTTGKLQVGALVTGTAAAVTQGVQMAQPLIEAGKTAIHSVDGMTGYPMIIAGVLVGLSILFTVATMVHKARSLGGDA